MGRKVGKQQSPRRVASYSRAIQWLVWNDETDWLDDPEDLMPTVAADLVADLFGRSQSELAADMRRARAA